MRCTCNADAYSLNSAEVVVHRADGPCTIEPAQNLTAGVNDGPGSLIPHGADDAPNKSKGDAGQPSASHSAPAVDPTVCNAIDVDNCAEHGWWTRFKCERTCNPRDYAWDLPHYKDCTIWSAALAARDTYCTCGHHHDPDVPCVPECGCGR